MSYEVGYASANTAFGRRCRGGALRSCEAKKKGGPSYFAPKEGGVIR